MPEETRSVARRIRLAFTGALDVPCQWTKLQDNRTRKTKGT